MKLKNITLITLFIAILNYSYSQKTELDFGVGLHLSNLNFHHSFDVDKIDGFYPLLSKNSNFKIGLTAPLSKSKWYLETEIGFLKTISLFAINYTYDEGFGEQRTTLATYLTNQKIYLSIAPEYRIDFKSITIKINGGLIISSDILNSMTPRNTILLPKSSPSGVKFGTGIQYIFNRIGIDFNISYAKIGQSELQNRYHPKISYDLILISSGVIYSL